MEGSQKQNNIEPKSRKRMHDNATQHAYESGFHGCTHHELDRQMHDFLQA